MAYKIVENLDQRAVALSNVSRMEILSGQESMAWVRDVHVAELPPSVGAVVMVGNSDSPDGFLAYEDPDPLVSDTPVIYVREEES